MAMEGAPGPGLGRGGGGADCGARNIKKLYYTTIQYPKIILNYSTEAPMLYAHDTSTVTCPVTTTYQKSLLETLVCHKENI